MPPSRLQEALHQVVHGRPGQEHRGLPGKTRPRISKVAVLKRARQHGSTHAFVVEFESEQDRDYYVNEDPAQASFVLEVLQKLDKATILDFSPGVF